MLPVSVSAQPVTVSDSLDAETVTERLQTGIALWEQGDFARARTVFESVLRLDDLPPDVHSQTDVYAAAAKAWLEGRPAVAGGYAVISIGRYRERGTIAGPGVADDRFGGLRAGGRVNIPASPRFAVNASVDYQFRRYDAVDRHDDSDLRWGLGGSYALGAANLGFGTRGWVSDRGDGIRRNDAALYTDLRWASGDHDQFRLEGEVRRRGYPEGGLRYRSRDLVQVTASWTHALAGGRASFTLAGHGGREFARAGNPYGDSNIFGFAPSIDVTISDAVAAYGYGWWQRGRYNRERLQSEIADAGTIGTRADTLIEVGGGVLWRFAPGWEAGPSVLHLRDRSNLVGFNYSSTEMLLMVRKDF